MQNRNRGFLFSFFTWCLALHQRLCLWTLEPALVLVLQGAAPLDPHWLLRRAVLQPTNVAIMGMVTMESMVLMNTSCAPR